MCCKAFSNLKSLHNTGFLLYTAISLNLFSKFQETGFVVRFMDIILNYLVR